MTSGASIPPKPRSKKIRPEIVRMPRLTRGRLFARWFWHSISWLLIHLLTRPEVSGLQNFPSQGPVLLATNHLGDTDAIMSLAFFPHLPETFAKAELYDYPILGKLMDAYGVIWLHRGVPDRKALRAALGVLAEGRILAIAPEGRESLTGALEHGTEGAAYLACRSEAPIVPIVFTGTANRQVFGSLKRLRRPRVTLRVGEAFRLPSREDHKTTVEEGTRFIMERLASLLPPEYRGVYKLPSHDQE
jgi:1-acyl-sn-glycerol-3-phosphate acyltransferase